MKNSKITLGISDSHDSGACFFIGDKLVYAVSEERLNRKKKRYLTK
jgi:predicted NodU family carbamoyl transferase